MTESYLYFLSLLAARTAIIFIVMVVGLRLLGKRQIGQMNLYDLATIMALSNAVQNSMTSGTGNLTTGIVCAGTLLVLGRIATIAFVREPRLESSLCGTPSVVINDGKLVEDHMRREGITEDELIAALRQHGLSSPTQARMAVLEIDGTLSVVPFEPGQSPTPPSGPSP